MDGAGIGGHARTRGESRTTRNGICAMSAEISIDGGYRRAILGEPASHTMLTSAISGRLARSMMNRFTELGARGGACRRRRLIRVAYDAGKALHAAAKAQGRIRLWRAMGGQAARARTIAAAGRGNSLRSSNNEPRGHRASSAVCILNEGTGSHRDIEEASECIAYGERRSNAQRGCERCCRSVSA